ncbi:sialin-like [Planococcus citri]|uniref:sialin-like n=1 Tax=Planococcus citri TaxID=170843 RepID=UPI0031F8ACCA
MLFEENNQFIEMKSAEQKVVDSTVGAENGLNETKRPNPGIGKRHLQSLLLALCVFCGYLQRVNLSVTIVAMTKFKNAVDEKQIHGFPTYDWGNDIRSYLHAAFFLGYFVMNLPAAWLGVHFNLKMLLMVTFLINGVLSCCTPFLINFTYTGTNDILLQIKSWAGIGNWRALVVLRAIQGILQAFMLPTIHAISAKWAPPNERGRLVGFIMGGIPFGTMVTLAGSGLLAGNSYLGWPSVFYVSGAFGLIWSLFWAWFGSSSPATHSTISSQEYNYITSELPIDKTKKKVPWFEILTSLHVWAIIVAHTTHNWGFWLLLSEMPTFLHVVSGFNIKSDGLLSSTPYATMWLLQFPVMWIADGLNKKGITSITASRKIWTSIGQWGGAIGLIALGYLNNNTAAAVAFYIAVIGIGCCCNVGFHLNHMDLTPNYSGILMGLSNAFAATGGLGAPLLFSYFVHDVSSVGEWRIVFYLGAGILFFGNLFFVIFASSKTQQWNNKYTCTPSHES